MPPDASGRPARNEAMPDEPPTPTPLATPYPAGFFAALDELLQAKSMTEGFGTMVLEKICRPLACKFALSRPEQAALVAGGNSAPSIGSGPISSADESLLRKTSPQEVLAQMLYFGALHRLPFAAAGEPGQEKNPLATPDDNEDGADSDAGANANRRKYDEDGSPVQLVLNLPLLQTYHIKASLLPTAAECDEKVFGQIKARVNLEWKNLRNEHKPLSRLYESLRGKLTNAINEHCGATIECVKSLSRDGNGILRRKGSDAEPEAKLDLAAIAGRIGKRTARGSPNDGHLGMPTPKEMGDILRHLLMPAEEGTQPDPVLPLEAVSVFQFTDLCIVIFSIPTPGKAELKGDDGDDERTDEEKLTSLELSQKKLKDVVNSAVPVVGISPSIIECAKSIVATVRTEDSTDLPDTPLPETRQGPLPVTWDEERLRAFRKKISMWQWQQTLAEGVLWMGLPLVDGSGDYEKADFVRVSGHAHAQAYLRFDRTLRIVGDALCDPEFNLEADEPGLALRWLMKKFLPWKPEIVADVALELPTGLTDP